MPIRNSRRSSNPIFSKRKLYLAMLASSSLAFPLDTLAGPESAEGAVTNRGVIEVSFGTNH